MDFESYIGHVARKPVFGVSDNGSFKTVSSATETSQKIKISPVASLHMIRFKKQIRKLLISLDWCVDWSAPVLFSNPGRWVFSHQGPHRHQYKFASSLLAVISSKTSQTLHESKIAYFMYSLSNSDIWVLSSCAWHRANALAYCHLIFNQS